MKSYRVLFGASLLGASLLSISFMPSQAPRAQSGFTALLNGSQFAPQFGGGSIGAKAVRVEYMTGGVNATTECHVINTRSGTLRFTNNTFDGEMCIVDAEAVGSACN